MFKRIGLDGLDLTVRPGGHIAPEAAPRELPKAVQAAKQHGVRILMLTTAITDPDKNAEGILARCGEFGIERVKLGYYHYKGFGTLRQQIDDCRKRIERVAKLARKYQVLPCVHIHSGSIIPCGGHIAYELFRDFSPEDVGAYVDPMHMVLEGGVDGWRQGLDLLAPWIALSSLKNASWHQTERDQDGQQRWRYLKCPLADGIAPIRQYVGVLNQLGYRGIYTLHSEYNDSGSFRRLNIDECLEQTRKDFVFVKKVMAAG